MSIRADAGGSTAARPIRVAHLTTVDTSLRYLLMAQLTAVVERGGEVIGISAPGPDVAMLEDRGVRHVPLPSSTRGMNPWADIRAAGELWRVLRRERPDVLHTHNPKPGWYGRIVGRLARVPLVVNTVHGLYASEHDRIPRRLAVYSLEAVASRFSHVELVQNPEDMRLMRKYRLAPRTRLRLLGNGVDLDRFDVARFPAAARAEERRSLGVGDGQIAVGVVARLVEEKGLPELFLAMESLGDRFVLLVAGAEDPQKGDALDAATLEQARSAGVRLVGHQVDVERFYLGLDVFVLPSRREGFPRAAMEAAAMGLPVIATDVRGCRQVVEDGHNGLLVPPFSPPALGEAIARLGGDADLRTRMGAAGRKRAEAEFDERAVVEIVLDSYGMGDEAADGAMPTPPSRRRSRRPARAVKRLLDVVLAATALVFLAPVLLVVAVLIRLALGRPVLFRQTRPGRHGELFTIVKFRTMRDETDDHGRLLPDEERLGRVGAFLRSTSLDELPELFNVLTGDMSLVGPRPLLVGYLDVYSAEHARRHDVRPGITGWAQVNGRNDQTWQDRLDHDVWYVECWSLWVDARILARTVRQTLRREGITHDGHATMPPYDGTEVGPSDEA